MGLPRIALGSIVILGSASPFGVLFPGQGAQNLGMGLDIAALEPAAAAVFDVANEILDFDLRAVIGGADKAALDRTDVCQPAILVTSLAVMAGLTARGLLNTERVAACAGLSLGEYSALAWAGALSLEDAIRLVRARGQAMQAASDENPSGMLSLVGASRESAEALVSASRGDGVLVLANMLAPGQIAIGGTTEALDGAQAACREHGIRKAVPLAVAGAFHSPCMDSAAASLGKALDATTFTKPRIPVVLNVTGQASQDPGVIADALRRQISSPVLWQASMETLFAMGVSDFFEPAPGRQLTNMLRRYEVETKTGACGNADDFSSMACWPGVTP
ncbi:MAG: [acyl-carrier-protein] S-malonyltransferase [Pseudohongiellaceae bacterium]|jgi:[acyl-carrier-protein] S-malonyltransferase